MTDQMHSFQLPVERWFAAIEKRRSRRAFSDQSLPADELERLATFCVSPGPFPATRCVLIRDAPADIFVASKEDRADMPGAEGALTGIFGSYGRITGASSVLAFVGQIAGEAGPGEVTPAEAGPGEAGSLDAGPGDSKPAAATPADLRPAAAAAGSPGDGFAVEAQVGYTGEAAVLEATAQGLDTCWLGGFFSASLTARLIDAQPGEHVFAITPVGHAVEGLSRKERYLFQMGRPKKRRALEHIALGLATKDWPRWAVAGVLAARVAPSAVNRQPWRFRLDGDSVLLACDAPDSGHISRRLECGIAMLHFELGVRHFGHDGAWEPPGTGKPLDVARWRPAR